MLHEGSGCSAHAPGAPPASAGTVPGGVIQVGTVGSPSLGVALTAPTNPSGYDATPTVPTVISTSTILIILAGNRWNLFRCEENLNGKSEMSRMQRNDFYRVE